MIENISPGRNPAASASFVSCLAGHRKIAGSLAMLLCVGWVAPAYADAREVTCESIHNSRGYCGIGRHGAVQLVKQIGWSSCEQGRSWGIETEGIWVDQGCRAIFRVESGKGGHDNSAAIIAGVAGAAIIGALLYSVANSDKSGSSHVGPEGISDDMVGDFEGFDSHEHVDVTLHVRPDGNVEATAGEQNWVGRYEHGRVRFSGGHEYRIEKTKRGVRLFNIHDTRNVVDMFRI